jgi:hypothetical protein
MIIYVCFRLLSEKMNFHQTNASKNYPTSSYPQTNA